MLDTLLCAHLHLYIHFEGAVCSNLAHFLIGFFFFSCWIQSVLYLFWYKSFVKYVTCKYFIPLWGVSFYLQRVLCRAKVLNFDQVQIIFSFMDHALYIHMAERSKSKETLPNPQSQNPHVIPIWLKHQALGQLRVLSYVISMMLVSGFKESTKNPLVHCNKQRVRAS